MKDMQNANKPTAQAVADFHMKHWNKNQFSVSTSEEAKAFLERAENWYKRDEVKKRACETHWFRPRLAD